MATTAIRSLDQRPFTEESISLRSFPVHTNSPSPSPSLKASSLKVRRALAFSNILGSRGRNTAPKYFEPTIQDLICTDQPASQPSQMALSNGDAVAPQPQNSSPESQQDQKDAMTRPRSKSRTIIRMLTTKLAPRSAPSASAIPKPTRPPAPNAFSKEQRDAALRERGLLPPLRPNKDLSQQESELDARLPVAEPVQDPPSTELSAADLIKREWETKNVSVQREERQRLNSFKFGGSSPSPVASPSIQIDFAATPSEQLDPAQQEPSSTELVPSSSDPSSLPVAPISTEDRPKTPSSLVLDLFADVEAYLVALPPSPSPSRQSDVNALDETFSSLAAASVPLPLSVPTTPSTQVHELPKEDTVPVHDTLEPPSSAVPLIALTPATLSPVSPREYNDDPTFSAIASAFHARADSFARLEESISTDSGLTSSVDTSSTSRTTDSSAVPSVQIGKGPGKIGGLTVQTHEGATIPVIVESPIDAYPKSELAIVVEEPEGIPVPAKVEIEVEPKAEEPLDNRPSTSSPEPLIPVPSSPEPPKSPRSPRLPFGRKRGVTDPTTTTVERKKTLNLFKRGNTLNSAENSTLSATDSPESQKSSTFSSMRRSVVGTLSRPKSIFTGSNLSSYTASHLPPSPSLPPPMSPTSPTSMTSSMRSRLASSGSLTPQPRPPRQAVAPVLYSRGSILMEAAGIEDEESRRMTELAFLG